MAPMPPGGATRKHGNAGLWPSPRFSQVALRRCAVLRTARAGPHRENWPEVGVPWPSPWFSQVAVRRCAVLRTARAGPHRENWPEVGVPWPTRRSARWRGAEDDAWPCAKKTMAANSVRCPPDRGESVKGGTPPFTIKKRPIGTRRRAPPAHEGVSIPEPGAAGSRVPRPQPLPLRGLRAALAALRKPARSAGRFPEGASPT